uniref:Uncharacterized protein n=1 Tax=Nelumbo nucifera TaxID=4432 RepID=A0A822YY79_NELNU|nr:TPA_asm: hypothetical protein HUJ06_004848 [Nelumbo nucifera]
MYDESERSMFCPGEVPYFHPIHNTLLVSSIPWSQNWVAWQSESIVVCHETSEGILMVYGNHDTFHCFIK